MNELSFKLHILNIVTCTYGQYLGGVQAQFVAICSVSNDFYATVQRAYVHRVPFVEVTQGA